MIVQQWRVYLHLPDRLLDGLSEEQEEKLIAKVEAAVRGWGIQGRLERAMEDTIGSSIVLKDCTSVVDEGE